MLSEVGSGAKTGTGFRPRPFLERKVKKSHITAARCFLVGWHGYCGRSYGWPLSRRNLGEGK